MHVACFALGNVDQSVTPTTNARSEGFPELKSCIFMRVRLATLFLRLPCAYGTVDGVTSSISLCSFYFTPVILYLTIQAELRAKGWELRRQEGDGNCLFRAISQQIYGDPGEFPLVQGQQILYFGLPGVWFSHEAGNV